MSKNNQIDACIQAAPGVAQAKLKQLRALIQEFLPEADEAISYGMPAYKLRGKGVVAFAGYKQHVGFYPMSGSLIEDFKHELAGYKTSKGAVQFSLDKPLPKTLIKKLIRARVKQIQVVLKSARKK